MDTEEGLTIGTDHVTDPGQELFSAPGNERILVCVSPSPASDRLIHVAHDLAGKLGATWLAVTVDAPDAYATTALDRQRLLAHLRLADALGAETLRLSGRRVSQEVVRCAQQHGVTRILMGKPTLRRWRDRFRPSLVHELLRDSGPIQVQFIAESGIPPIVAVPPPPEKSVPWRDSLISLALVALTTLLIDQGRQWLIPPDLVMLYLLPIMGVAYRFGMASSLLASALSVAAYDFFFVHPYFTFSVSDSQYVLTFAILFMVGIVISGLMTRIRRQELEARERERQTDALHRLSREVMTTLDDREVARIVTRHAARLFGGEAALFLEEGGGSLVRVAATPEAFVPAPPAMPVQLSYGHGQEVGKGTPYPPQGEIIALPIAGTRACGAMVIQLGDTKLLDATHGYFLEAFARQASLAMDRARLGEEARAAAIRVKSEELRGALLGMVSHDLRTPLAAITGAGTALRDEGAALGREQRCELLETICVEAERMERLITNLLNMVRLESGGCHLRREWIPFEEMAGSALACLESRCQGREVMVRVDEEVPLLHVDPVIFEQVLVNLLDNALKYTPAGTPLVWTVTKKDEHVTLSLHDRGPGIPPDQAETIFEKFTRGETAGAPGSGLGLAICRGVVQAHGGSIQALTAPEGGGVFRILLPQPSIPPEILAVTDEKGDDAP
ncbi:MAG: DUF4118 domain-containing protein [Magnetococcales bacterium]|nr:DUF4118 domain-containing protein [Magnetococcales bacterium]MBF0150254.1 DUF4118 domain-containing protein [Magnetococcales bacterium]MBF0172165.1 DUF4118 domain-containing protein [Magnetococcales bacterium]